ncbi:UNVERIFIED_CONTAM: Dscam2 [Trichonephila clavipes]
MYEKPAKQFLHLNTFEAVAPESQGLLCPSQYTGPLGAEVYEQMCRSGEDPPEFREIFPDRLLRPGAKSSLRCLVTGNPLPQVSWRLYSRPVVEGLGVRIGDFVDSQGLLMSFINISAVTPEHGGIYSCHARNEIGAISHSARLSVFGPPYIHPMDNITVVTGDEVNVDCAVSGHPLRSIRWRKAGKETGTLNIFLLIQVVNPKNYLKHVKK